MKGFFKFITQTTLALTIGIYFTLPAFSEPPNLSLLKNEVKIYHDRGQYERDIECVIKKAKYYILREASINQKLIHPKKLAIVLDIDETSLSNYNKMVQRDFVGDSKKIHQDIMEANAPAINPMLNLYRHVEKQGVKIFFVTGRPKSEEKATYTNLIRAGYSHWAGLYLRPNQYNNSSIIPFKSSIRKLITEQGYTIVASIGDQFSDLRGGYRQKGFKLPNPFYYLP